MEFLGLCDDDLLLVLRYVDTADLLRCRAVCRRLKDLAFHPELWRRRWIMVGSYYSKSGDCNTVSTDAAALRLAPCARTLALSDPFVVPAAARTRCAAMELMLPPFRGGTNTAKILADIVVNQTQLGRLKELLFELHEWPGERLANNIIIQAKGLSALTLFVYFSERSLLLKLPKFDVHVPTLKKVWLVTSRNSFFVKNILSGHAKTLEEVTLQWRNALNPYANFFVQLLMEGDGDSGQTVELFLQITHLRKLTCPLVKNLEHLNQISSLTALTLDVTNKGDLESAKRYLQSAAAAQLTHFGVRCLIRNTTDEEEATYVFERFVTILKTFFHSNRPCKVETLDLRVLGSGKYSAPPSLYNFLTELLESSETKLPELKCLVLDTGIAVFQLKQVMTMLQPEITPQLTRLEVGIYHGCLHRWIHTESFQDMFKGKGFKTVFLNKTICDFSPGCKFCSLGCHLVPGICNDLFRTTIADNS